MVAFFSFAGLLVFWVVLIALVKFEKGWVGLTPAQMAVIRLRAAVDRMTLAVGEILLPSLRALSDAFVKAGEHVARLLELVQEDTE